MDPPDTAQDAGARKTRLDAGHYDHRHARRVRRRNVSTADRGACANAATLYRHRRPRARLLPIAPAGRHRRGRWRRRPNARRSSDPCCTAGRRIRRRSRVATEVRRGSDFVHRRRADAGPLRPRARSYRVLARGRFEVAVDAGQQHTARAIRNYAAPEPNPATAHANQDRTGPGNMHQAQGPGSVSLLLALCDPRPLQPSNVVGWMVATATRMRTWPSGVGWRRPAAKQSHHAAPTRTIHADLRCNGASVQHTRRAAQGRRPGPSTSAACPIPRPRVSNFETILIQHLLKRSSGRW